MNINEINSIVQDVVFLDIETSGLNPYTSEILEIGAIKIENNKNIKLAIFIYCINISVSVNTAYILKNIKYIVIIDAYTKLFNTFPVTKSFIFFTILFFSFESFSNFLSSFLFVYMPFYHFFLDLSSVFIMFSLK